jgi:ribosomal protein S18 acetylase RimI-like enzyme
MPYTDRMWNLLNLSFKDLYGFTNLTKKQTDVYTKQYFPYINPDYVCFLVNDKDELVGFGISFPSLTRALQKCNGRLFPIGFIHLLSALKKKDIIDMDMNGVHPDYQGKGIVSIYHLEIHKGYIRNNVKKLVTNPQLDGNAASQMWKMYNGRQHITRRCWIKQL